MGDGFFKKVGNADTCEQEKEAADGADDHGIPEDVSQRLAQGKTAFAAERLENKDAHDVENRNDDGNHHGRDGEGVAAENVFHHGDSQEDEVAAVEGLDHGPAGLVVLGDPQDEKGRPGDDGEDGGDGKNDQFRPQGLVQRCNVQVVEHHAEEKDFENHAVHAADFVVVQQFAPADIRARQDQKKQGDDGLDGDEKVLLHDFTRFCF